MIPDRVRQGLLNSGFLAQEGLIEAVVGSTECLLKTADSDVDNGGLAVLFGIWRVENSSTRLASGHSAKITGPREISYFHGRAGSIADPLLRYFRLLGGNLFLILTLQIAMLFIRSR